MSGEDTVVGRRIVIYGVTGSGKTTVSRRLGALLRLPVIELDAIRHDGAWDATPFDIMRTRLAAAIEAAPQGWVCEGNYNKVRDVALSQADTVIWLRLPWRVSFTRLFRRTLRYAWTQEPLFVPNGPHESIRTSFFSRQSVLWWSIHHHHAGTRSIATAVASAPHGARVIVLRSADELDALMRRLGAPGCYRRFTAAR